jgi:hypothetical protein
MRSEDVQPIAHFNALLTFAFCLFTLPFQGEETEQAPQPPVP